MTSLLKAYFLNPVKKVYRYAGLLACAAMFISFAIPAQGAVGFVDYSGGKEAVPLAPYLECFVDESGSLSIEGMFTQEIQNKFSPLSDGLPLNLRGTLWLRFTLPPTQPGLEPPFLRLDLGRGVPAGAEMYLPDGNLNAALTTWIPQPPLEKNIFLLQFLGFSRQAQAPVTVYVKIPGAVGLWFAPQLLTTEAVSLKGMSGVSLLDMLAVFWSWLLAPSSSLVYIVLGVLTLWCLSRAFRRGGEWRLWTAVFSALALLQGLVPMPYSPAGRIPLQALLNVVIPGLCFILLIHVGRHLLHSKERLPRLDSFLVALSFLGVLLPVIPLVPGMGGLLRLMPLWPFLGVLPALACLPAAMGKMPGAKRYAFSCLILALGGALALSVAGRGAPLPFLVQAPLWAAALFVFLVGVTRVRERPAKIEEEEPGEGVEILRLNDLVAEGTLDDLLPPLPQKESSLTYGFETEDAPALKLHDPAEPLAQAEDAATDSGFLSMSGSSFGASPAASAGMSVGAKRDDYLKLVPKLAATTVPEKMPKPVWEEAPAQAPESSLPFSGSLTEKSDEEVVELRDIISSGETRAEFENVMPGVFEGSVDVKAESAAGPLPAVILESETPAVIPESEAPATIPESGELRVFWVAEDTAPPAETPVAAARSSVSEPRPIFAGEHSQEAPYDEGEVSDPSAEPPWRRPLGGVKRGIDMLGDLIKHGGPAEAAPELKEPVLGGPDLLSSQQKAAQWSGRAGGLLKGDAESSAAPEEGPSERTAGVWPRESDELPAAAPLAESAVLPQFGDGNGVDFSALVDETAHADALWAGQASSDAGPLTPETFAETDPLLSTEDVWKLSDMGRHGQAPQSSAPAESIAQSAAPDGVMAQNFASAGATAQNIAPGGPIAQHGEEKMEEAPVGAATPISEPTLAAVAATELSGGNDAREIIFDLQLVLSSAHDAVRGEAERKNLALSWFMPPHLPLLYLGDAGRLQDVLQKLLESAVAATDKGTVQLAVRRVPDSTDPGHLIFSVADSGDVRGASRRDPLALEQAWNLAADMGGSLNVESAPGQGATVAFTMRLKRPADDIYGGMAGLEGDPAMLLLHSGGTERVSIVSRRENHILVADEQATNRQLIAFFLGNLPYRVVEAKSLDEALAIYAQRPTGLVILDAQLEELNVSDAVRRLHNMDSSLKLNPVPVVALIQDHDEIAAMLSAGCKGTLRKPLSRKRVRDLMQMLLPREEAEREAEERLELKEPIKDSPEDYVSHLEFSPLEMESDAAESVGAVERAAMTSQASSAWESASAKNVEADASDVPPTHRAEVREGGRPVAGWDKVRGGVGGVQVERVKAESAGTGRAVATLTWQSTPEKSENEPVGTGKSRWLSSFLDAAGKMAGVAGQAERPAEKLEENLAPPVLLDEQSLRKAGLEQEESIHQVLEDLDAALWSAKRSLAEENSLAVSQACLRLAGIASRHHLENLERIALCVERAAQANDLEAIKDLLAELEASTLRNRKRVESALHGGVI